MILQQLKQRTGLPLTSIEQVLALFEEGATVPFIARYRKERTGSLDEVQISLIQQEWEHLKKLEKRKETIIAAIRESGKLTDQIEKSIVTCWDVATLEDIYLPFKKTRKTKADTAIENGLEPLAKIIAGQRSNDIQKDAKRFIHKDVPNTEDALEGARHIISAWVNENSAIRNIVRSIFEKHAFLESKVVNKKKTEATNYRDYFEFSERLSKCPSHRLLAIYRGDEEGLLKLKITIDEDRALERLERYYIKSPSSSSEQMQLAIKDALKRLILPSIENEFKKSAKEKADKEAIDVFANNLRQLLLAPPLGNHNVLAIDPGFRTGCKIVLLDEGGVLLKKDTIYPHPPQHKTEEAATKIKSWVATYKVKHVAIGNGTAGRETYQFLQDLRLPLELYLVNENGASIYSASQVAREEFPDLDLTVRGTISIGRRLMDPLAELVKIDPKSIGVGQYQHDVHQTMLKESLDRTVTSCVNQVGVNLNTASQHLLRYVSGVGPALAENIVSYRNELGGFTTREQLLSVPRMGQKAYEQAAGFLRIKEGARLLDNTGIHPERYPLVRKMLQENNIPINAIESSADKLKNLSIEKYVGDEVGYPTLKDIINELLKPGLDARGAAKPVQFSAQIKSMEDLKKGMILNGVVNNLTKFGAFVDLGIKESALLHISQITDRFIRDPAEVLSLQQEVSVKILELDPDRKRISLTMKF